MKQIRDVENKLESILNSLDGIQRATPRPYFYTRLRVRMTRRDNAWGGIIGVISRPLFAVAIVCVVLLVNSWIFFRNDVTPTNATNAASAAVSTDIPDEYNVAVNTFYNYEMP